MPLVKNPTVSTITVPQSITIGSIAGAAEVLVNHPLWTIKTRLQQGKTFMLNPSVLYRGLLPNAVSMIPITAMQIGLNRAVQQYFFKTSVLTDQERITSAFIAGLGSAAVCCPTEMVMTYQGKAGESFYAVGKQLLKQGGWRGLFTALPATAIRESMFTTFFLAGTPILKAQLTPYCPSETSALLASGMIAGVGATYASQAADTLKTVQQAASPHQAARFTEAAKKVYSSQGVYGFFKGSVPRGARVVSAVTLMGFINEKLEAAFQDHNHAKQQPL